MGVDYVRDYLPFLPHTTTLAAMYACVAVVAGLFVWGAVRRYRRYRGAGGSLWAGVTGGELPWGPRLRRAVVDVVAQSKVRERRLPAALHLPLFYGIVLLVGGTAIVGVYEDVLRWFGDFTLQGTFYVLFEGVLDAAGLALVAGVCIALWRRLVMRPEYLVPAGLNDRHPAAGCCSWASRASGSRRFASRLAPTIGLLPPSWGGRSRTC